MTKEQCTDVT